MASSIVKHMTEKLQAVQASRAKRTQQEKKQEETLLTGIGTLAGAGGGAFIDCKGQNGGPHKLFAKADGTGGFPTNVVAGGVIAAVAMVASKKVPMAAPIAATGLSLLSVGLYRFIVDKHAANAAANGA